MAVVSDNINLDQDSTWANVVNMADYYPLASSFPWNSTNAFAEGSPVLNLGLGDLEND